MVQNSKLARSVVGKRSGNVSNGPELLAAVKKSIDNLRVKMLSTFVNYQSYSLIVRKVIFVASWISKRHKHRIRLPLWRTTVSFPDSNRMDSHSRPTVHDGNQLLANSEVASDSPVSWAASNRAFPPSKACSHSFKFVRLVSSGFKQYAVRYYNFTYVMQY